MSLCRQGITLRSLLEHPELLAEPIRSAPDKAKDVEDIDDCVASQLAFLGPNIWERTLPSNLVDLNVEGFTDLETNVDFSAFLDAELPNCPQVDIEAMLAGVGGLPALPPEKLATADRALLRDTNPVGPRKRNPSKSCNPVLKVKGAAPEIFPSSVNTPLAGSYSPSTGSFSPSAGSFSSSTGSFSPSAGNFSPSAGNFSPSTGSFSPSAGNFSPSTGSFSPSADSFSPQPDELSQMSQLSHFSGSGDETFDPSKRAFSDEELRLLPVLKKSRKIFVPDDLKDDKYWARRIKNNTAAKRSREARRLKENQITMRTAFLEKENAFLKIELQRILLENESLKNRAKKHEAVCQKTC